MSNDDDAPDPPAERSMPGWVMTFADLMSLLMCFFVLLLSFSEMDLKKFKQVAGSMEKAFGVQRKFNFAEAPRGTSIIAQEFSPGRPEPTQLNEIRQFTTEEVEALLKIEKEEVNSSEGAAQTIAETLIEEIRSGVLELEVKDATIIIRILEKCSFLSGSAELQQSFLPILDKIAQVLLTVSGNIIVAGYTDDIPIQTDIFRSNWELSAIRAFVVIDRLLKNSKLKPERFTLQGHAANNPLQPNNTSKNRSENRRVELIIKQQESIEEEDEVIKIEEDADVNNIPGIENIVVEEEENTFPPNLEITTDADETYENNELGVFEEDVLYNYELNEQVSSKK